MLDSASLTTVLVAAITGLSAAGGPLILRFMDGRRERKAVRAALLAEVSSIAVVIEGRRYISDLMRIERELSCPRPTLTSSSQDEVKGYKFQVVVPEGYNLIYRENTSKLGCLSPDEAGKVVHFYQLILSVIADLGPGGGGHDGSSDPATFHESRIMLEAALKIEAELCR